MIQFLYVALLHKTIVLKTNLCKFVWNLLRYALFWQNAIFLSKIWPEKLGTCRDGGRVTRKGREGRTLGFVDDLPSGHDAEEWNCFPLPAKFPPYSQDMLLPITYIYVYTHTHTHTITFVVPSENICRCFLDNLKYLDYEFMK